MGVDGGRGDVLGMAAIQVHAQALLIGTPLVVSHAAMLTVAAGDPVVQDDPVADLERGGGVGANGDHLAGDVAAQDAGQGSPVGTAPAHAQVKMVQGAAADAEHDFAGSHFRLGPVSVGQFVGAAVLLYEYCFH